MPIRHRVRYEIPQQARLLTCSCYRRLAFFGNEAIKDAFVEHLRVCRESDGFKLFAWVVMPEHFHLLLLPNLPTTPVSVILRNLKEPFARMVIGRWKELDAPILSTITDSRGSRHFWQRGGGHDRNILGGHELPEKINYIHMNPVRRGLVTRPEAWRWSSASWYAHPQTGTIPIDRPH